MPSMASPLLIQVLLLATSFLAGALAQYCPEGEPCIHLKVVHSTNKNVFSKRAVEVQLANRSDVAYYAELNIGSPTQQVYVQLDTGSFELWVNPTCANLDLSDEAFCNAIGFYNTSRSSTAQNLGQKNTLNYGIGSANITYFKDDISLPGAATAMTGVQFGVASATTQEFSGILGIGYGKGYTTTYRNFVDELAFQNQTDVKAFSVALGSKDEQEGVIVFGGVDTSKFAGRLATLPIVPAAKSPDGVARYWISMNNISLTPPSGQTKTYSNSTIDVFLDTGATLTLLPQDLADAIGADFGASSVDSSGFYPVDCSLTDLDGTVNFAFNGVTIQVPYNELIRGSTSGDNSCVLGISPSSSFALLGDSFMRSAYGMPNPGVKMSDFKFLTDESSPAVFDLDNNQIHMQQYTNCGTTPAAIADASMFSGLEGVCNSSRELTMVPSLSGSSSADPSGDLVTATGSPTETGSAATTVGTAAAATGSISSSSSSSASSSGSETTRTASSGNSIVMRQQSLAALWVALIVLPTLI